jgi:putative tricarboxylic transport membrane protein
MRRRTVVRVAASAGLPLLAGCGEQLGGADGSSDLRIMVPNKPGSGYDVTARVLTRCLEDARVLRDVEVFNLPGAGGTVGLRRLVDERGNDQLLMLMGLGVVGSQYTDRSRAGLADTTPIARLIEEPDIVVVPPDSPYRSLADVVRDWRADPGRVRIGGGSEMGGPDHLATMLMAEAIGVAPRTVSYRSYDGGGVLLAAILARQVAVGVSGLTENEPYARTGQLRVLAVTSARPVPELSAPTLRGAGVDVVFTNWRGIVAPPGLPPAAVARHRGLVARLHGSAAWRRVLTRDNWTDAYLSGDPFGRFLREQGTRVAQILGQFGLSPRDG